MEGERLKLKCAQRLFFAIHLILISMQQNTWNLNAGTLTHMGLCWINSNRQFTRAQSLNRYECWKNLKSLSFFYSKSLSFFWRWLLWILKEFKITFTFFIQNHVHCFYLKSLSQYFTVAFMNMEKFRINLSQLFIRCTETLKCRR